MVRPEAAICSRGSDGSCSLSVVERKTQVSVDRFSQVCNRDDSADVPNAESGSIYLACGFFEIAISFWQTRTKSDLCMNDV